MIDLATAAVETALAAGARYADARAMVVRHETIAARNGVVEDLTQAETAGVGVRALLGSSWGFLATPTLTDAAARQAGAGATAVALASARLPGLPLQLSPAPVSWRCPDASRSSRPTTRRMRRHHPRATSMHR